MTTRTAVVTGGIGGLGTEICLRLAASGHEVIAIDLDRDADRVARFRARAEGMKIHFQAADVGDPQACTEAISGLEARHGGIDILVNAAGITRDARLVNMQQAQWDDVLRINLDSVYTLCRLTVPGMCERGFGRIVNISSVNGQTGQFGQTNYAAAKAGMHGFTMALAREVARKGVTVNSVSPGYIDTDLTRAMREDIRTRIIDSIPVGRIGQPADIARSVDFLCAEDASYITGVNLPVNGGLFISF